MDRPLDPRLSALQLLYRYGELIDLGDFEGVAELLAPAELTFQGQDLVCRGPGEVLALYRATARRYEDGTPRTKHVITNPIMELEPSGLVAGCRSYFTVLQAVPG